MKMVATNCVLAVTLLSSAVLPSDTMAQSESPNATEVTAEVLPLNSGNSAIVVTEAAPSDEAIDEAIRLQSVDGSWASQPSATETRSQIIYQDNSADTSNVVGTVVAQTNIASASISDASSVIDAPIVQSVPYECGPIIFDGDCSSDRGVSEESDLGTFYDGSTDCGCDRVAPVVPMELRKATSSSACCCVDPNASSAATAACTAPQDSNSNGCPPTRRGLLRRLFGR